jgi:hypothetical protein
MDSSFREQEGAGTPQEAPKSFLAGLQILAGFINWLAGLFNLTEKEQEEAGIYLDRLGGE